MCHVPSLHPSHLCAARSYPDPEQPGWVRGDFRISEQPMDEDLCIYQPWPCPSDVCALLPHPAGLERG